MKKEKKAYKGWVDPMCTPYHTKKGWHPREYIKSAIAAEVVERGDKQRIILKQLSPLKTKGGVEQTPPLVF